jgi:hypothetical protein
MAAYGSSELESVKRRSANFPQVLLRDVLAIDSEEHRDCKMGGFILHVKSPQGNTAIQLQWRQKERGAGCLSANYFRLIYVAIGRMTAVILIPRGSQSKVLYFEHLLELGMSMWIVNPKCLHVWEGIPIIQCTWPLFKAEGLTQTIGPVALPMFDEFNLRAFCVTVDAIQNVCATFIEACDFPFCDARYGMNNVCPCSSARLSSIVFVPEVEFTIPEFPKGIELAPFSSHKLGLQVFEEKKIRFPQPPHIPYHELASFLENEMERHVGGYRVSGWFRPQAGCSEKILHVSFLEVLGHPLSRYAPE